MTRKCRCHECEFERLKKDVETQRQLDEIPIHKKFLDPVTFAVWGYGVILPMTLLGFYLGTISR